MALWTWWPGDSLPLLSQLDNLSTDSTSDLAELAPLTGLDENELRARLDAGNRCYLARLAADPVAYGWVASSGASIGELDVRFQLADSDRYLWDFQTLPAWRGHGVYPRLLQAILANEGPGTHRFWIITAPENGASAKGIHKAGFRPVAELAFGEDGQAGLLPLAGSERARVGAQLLGVPSVDGATARGGMSPCWCCVIDAARKGGHAVCWPVTAQELAPCTCGRSGARSLVTPSALSVA